jgi:ABC-type multidrug transport system fused ATPase/permease subunit
MAPVPLSEDEQRILLEIEQRLTEEDPDLVREVASTTVYTHALRNLKLASALFVLGVVAMIWLLGTNAVLAFGGFLIMLVAAVIFERNARRLGKAGVQQLTQNLRGGSVKDYFGSTSQRMRDRMRREDQ